VSDLKATLHGIESSFHVEGYEKIQYDLAFVDGVFETVNPNLADCYKRWGRVLAVTDKNVYTLYGKTMEAYFKHLGLDLKVYQIFIGEKAKPIETFLGIRDLMADFSIIRKVERTSSPCK